MCRYDVARDGFARADAVDYSEPCIQAMRSVQRTRIEAAAGDDAKPPPCEVDYQVMDVTAMTYADDSLVGLCKLSSVDV